ncbi:hypothetical protein [Agrobacterium tumefaciens]|uniref:hypothetical protein n=1 Tax=Agrobacterium tumefaciens TaxID=358 RepID=UPI0021D16F61|nr:hypothetical protein [Agrobacterium tumefaciens]UXS09203.1 hypothetical protein FY155_06110 [Agrobacterium tumefaciens]UXS16562.1 hypothetical protein FY154_06105 [Agrobacterium tumefaciens]
MKTRRELIVAVLELHQADGGVGQAPAPEDIDIVDKYIDGQLTALSRRGILSTEKERFDDEVVGPLATIIADECSPKFGVARNPVSRAEAELLLRQITAATLVPEDITPSEYF